MTKKERKVFMKKFKKVMAMGLATMAVVSAMSMSAMASDLPVDSITGEEFPNRSSISGSVETDATTRAIGDVTGEVWIYWNDWDYEDNMPSAYTYSIASQPIYMVAARMECNSNNEVQRTPWQRNYNTSAATSRTLVADDVYCVFDATGEFQYSTDADVTVFTHQERFPKD